MNIKVGILLSYDYEMVFPSINLIYDQADEIYLSYDKNFLTRSGKKFTIPETFFDEIKSLDVKNKIQCHTGIFYDPEVEFIARQTRQRESLLQTMGSGWKIFIDVDEYIYDFTQVAKFLNRNKIISRFPRIFPIILRGRMITLYKHDENGYYFIDSGERLSFITNQSRIIYKRNNKKIKNHFTNITVIHQSWARKPDEVKMKLENWGHKNDFDTTEYYDFWRNINSNNYHQFQNFHPIHPKIWKKLEYIPAQTLEEFIDVYSGKNKQIIYDINWKIIIKSLLRINR